MEVYYVIAEDGDDEAHPNCFVCSPAAAGNNGNKLTLGDVRRSFPLGGDGTYHFRFKRAFKTTHVWMDVLEDSFVVPSFEGIYFTKVSRIAMGGNLSASAKSRDEPPSLLLPHDEAAETKNNNNNNNGHEDDNIFFPSSSSSSVSNSNNNSGGNQRGGNTSVSASEELLFDFTSSTPSSSASPPVASSSSANVNNTLTTKSSGGADLMSTMDLSWGLDDPFANAANNSSKTASLIQQTAATVGKKNAMNFQL